MGTLIKEEDLKNPNFKFGFLFWDVPTKYAWMGNLIREKTRPFAKAVNNSVRIFPWENAALVEGTVLEIREETGQIGTVYVLPMTEECRPYLIPMVEHAMQEELGRLVKSLRERIDRIPALVHKAVEEGKSRLEKVDKEIFRRRKAVYREIKKKVEDLKAVAVAFRILDKFQGWSKLARTLLEEEAKAIEDLKSKVA